MRELKEAEFGWGAEELAAEEGETEIKIYDVRNESIFNKNKNK